MRFRIEQTCLTDDSGKVVPPRPASVVVHTVEADTLDEAINHFLATDGAQLVGNVLRLPGLQAVVTARRQRLVYTLQLHPDPNRLVTC